MLTVAAALSVPRAAAPTVQAPAGGVWGQPEHLPPPATNAVTACGCHHHGVAGRRPSAPVVVVKPVQDVDDQVQHRDDEAGPLGPAVVVGRPSVNRSHLLVGLVAPASRLAAAS